MSEETRWRVKNAIVEAVQWTGENIDEVFVLTGCQNFDALDDQDRANCDDPEATGTVYDKITSTWNLVKSGEWIVKGVTGVLFVVADEDFRSGYEPEGGAQPAITVTLAGYQGPAAHTYTAACDGFHPPAEACNLPAADGQEHEATTIPDREPDDALATLHRVEASLRELAASWTYPINEATATHDELVEHLVCGARARELLAALGGAQ